MNKRFFLLIIFAFGSWVSFAQQSQRLISNWEFVKGDLGGIWEAVRPASVSKSLQWEKVYLPHCVNAEDAVDPDVNY